MQGDQLLLQWKKAKEICYKIIQISKNANIYNKVEQKPMEKQTSREFMSVYDTVYKLCITKQKQQTRVSMVYKDFKQILKNALVSMCQQLKNQKDIYKLKYIRKIWDAYSDSLKRLMHMFAYLNRPFHIKEGRIQELEKTGMMIIVTTLFGQISIAEYEAIYFKEIDKIRKTQDFSNSQILKQMVDMLYKIHLRLIKNTNKKAITRYTQFYSKYLKIAKEYYTKRFNNLKQLHPTQYFDQISKMYALQIKIGEECFGIGGQTLIIKQFAQEFVQKYRKILMQTQKGLKSILKNKQIATLKIIIEMYSKLTKNIDGFKQQFQEFIFEDIKSFIEEMKNQILIKRTNLSYCNFLQKIINKNKEYLSILEQSFMHLGDFIAYYKTGVEKAFNCIQLPIKIQEILAIYADLKFKTSQINEVDFEQDVQNIMGIFVCIENKDLFLLKYTQKLAKRMLTTTPEGIKSHQIFVENLKLNCGIKFTERLETLIYENSLTYEYEPIIKKLLNENKLNIDMNLKIFSQGAWPTTSIVQIPLEYFPNQISLAYKCFQTYREEYNAKKMFKFSFLQSKIRWTYYFQKQIQNKFEECYFDTNCLQAAILYYIYRSRPNQINLQFLNQYFQKLPIKVIKQNINKMVQINENILIKTLKEGQTYYSFNGFMKSNKRIIIYDSGASTEEEKLFQQQDLGKDRQLILDANIAKYMKSKKITDFQTLFSEISKMIRVFVPQKKDIKLAIDRLINKELLSRDEKDMAKIKYVD